MLLLFEVISTCFWSDLRGQLWPLTSFGGSDWIFSILTPNHPIRWNLKSFQHVFEVTFEATLASDHLKNMSKWCPFDMLLNWPLRSTLASRFDFCWLRLNILNSNPKPSTIFNSNQFLAFFVISVFDVRHVPHHYLLRTHPPHV